MDIQPPKKSLLLKNALRKAWRAVARYNPHRDWTLLAIVFVILAGWIVVWQFHFFDRIEKGEAFIVERQELHASSTLNRIDLKKITDQLDLRKVEFRTVKQAVPSVIDPGL